MTWRFLNATAQGASHARSGTPCQDDCLVAVDDGIIIAIASDGAGSAQCAEEGSAITCEAFVAAAESWLRNGGRVEELTRAEAETWIAGIRTAIEERAVQRELALRDFACTLVAAMAGDEASAYLQIGDGAVIAGTDDSYEVIFWPDGGEYANATFFTTDDDWTTHLHFDVRRCAPDDVALMTDGLQRLALRFDTRSVHAPFFVPMFHALRQAECGFASALEPELLAFLGSAAVNERTDDDKSLILATRRGGEADAAR